MRAKLHGQPPEFTRRIFLNPTVQTSIGIFQQVIDAAEQQGLSIKAKLLDRSTPVISGVDRTKNGQLSAVRGDGIVLYATEQEADALFALAAKIYTDNYAAAFQGRTVSRIPIKGGDGFAIGAEPKTGGESSLTSHRSNALESALEITRNRLGISLGEVVSGSRRQHAIDTFRRLWPGIADAAGIDPNNIAFNKK